MQQLFDFRGTSRRSTHVHLLNVLVQGKIFCCYSHQSTEIPMHRDFFCNWTIGLFISFIGGERGISLIITILISRQAHLPVHAPVACCGTPAFVGLGNESPLSFPRPRCRHRVLNCTGGGGGEKRESKKGGDVNERGKGEGGRPPSLPSPPKLNWWWRAEEWIRLQHLLTSVAHTWSLVPCGKSKSLYDIFLVKVLIDCTL